MSATPGQIPFEEVGFRRFHYRLGIAGCGGQFADGFELGIIGIAVAIAAGPLQLSALQTGLLGAAALCGLFFGALTTGVIADRIGRRTIFRFDMILAVVISGTQYFATEAWHLLVLRLMLGFVLGADYVVSKSLVTELSPMKYRGRLLSLMAIAWAAGYTAAYLVGFVIRDMGPNSWRYMLAVSAVPALCIFILRLGIPESPLWLVKRGRNEEAKQIILQKLGPDVALPIAASTQRKKGGEWAELFSQKWRKRTAVGGIFYVCQVIPYFALGTFLPKIMESLGVGDKYSGSLVYNAMLMTGAIIGMIFIDKIPRRVFLITTFFFGAGLLFLLAANLVGSTGVVIVFALFALTLSAAANLEFIYPPELFPTHLRATGVGFATAVSRFGSALSTFLLPLVVEHYGVGTALGACVVVMITGGVVCQLYAPETGNVHLDSIGEDDKLRPVAATA
jgi:putative MFS transporter